MTNRLGMNDVPYDASRLNTLTLSSAVASADVDAITALTGDVTATGPGSVAATLATVNANVGTFGSATQVAQVTANAKGLITAIANVTIAGASPVGAALTRGSIWRGGATNLAEAYALGAANKVLQSNGTDAVWSTNTLTIAGNSTINGSLVGNMTGGGTVATGGFTGTIPETMTFAGRDVANTFTAVQTITGPSSTATTGVLVTTQTKTNPAGGGYSFNRFTGTIALSSNALGSQDFYAINATLVTSAAAVTYSNAQLRSLYLSVQHNNTGTIRILNGGFVDLYNISSGTVTEMYGYSGFLRNIGAGTIGTAAMFFAADAINSGGGTINNQYGVYILNQTKGSTLNAAIRIASQSSYALYCDGGPSYHAGNFGIGKAPSVALDVLLNNATTAAVDAITTLTHNTTGTAAAGFGGSISLQLESSTTADQAAASIKWLWSTATHASRKAKMQLAVNDTAERLGLAIEADGAAADVYFEGGAGSGFPYGGCYGNDINWTQASAAQNTWYIVSDADMTDSSGGLNLVTHDGSGKLTVTKAGRYRISYGATVGCSVANKLIQTTVAVNGTAVNDGIQHVIMNATANMVAASTAILSLAANDFVEFAIRTTDTGTPDISVEHLNITLVQVGG